MERDEFNPDFGGVDELPDELPLEDMSNDDDLAPEKVFDGTEDLPDESDPDLNFDPEEEFRQNQNQEKPKKKNNPLKARLEQVNHEKFQAIDALNRMQEENERLRQAANISTEAAVKHYLDTATMRLANARRSKADAYESGDTEKILDADTEYQLAINEAQQAQQWKASQEYQANQARQQQYQEPEVPLNPFQGKERVVSEWLSKNEWFDRDSENFDDALAAETEIYSARFNQNLINAGYGEQIGTPDYFNVINNHIASLKAQQQPTNRRNLNMSAPRGSVSSVRGGGRAFQGAQNQNMQLSPAERDIARRMGVDDKTMWKYVQLDKRENPHKRRGY